MVGYDDESSSSGISVTEISSAKSESFHEEEYVATDEVKRVQAMTETETRRLKRWRFVVIISLVFVGISVSTFTRIFLTKKETEAYVTSFFLLADTISEIISFRGENLFLALRNLGGAITAFEDAGNETFPFVTLPTFELAASHARKLSGLETIIYSPIMPAALMSEWETYSVNNFDRWMQRSKDFRLSDDASLANLSDFTDEPASATVEPLFGPPRSYEIVMPWWMTSPPPYDPIFINRDCFHLPLIRNAHKAAGELKDIVFTDFVDADTFNLNGLGYLEEEHDRLHDLFVERRDNSTSTTLRPHLYMYSPIYSRLGDKKSPFAAALIAQMTIDVYLKDLLTDGVRGIRAVVSNSCNRSYTYELTSDRAIFVGPGDRHDMNFDHMEAAIDLGDYFNPDKVSSIDGLCLYRLSLYPTNVFANDYKTQAPLVFTIVVAATFAFMVATFFVYDRFVDRRNDKVTDAAARAATIVSSLFPSTVRDRLYAQADEPQLGPYSRLKSFLHDGADAAAAVATYDDDVEDIGAAVYATKPIAELFPATTVMFADISGFTAWSSSREPAQVFVLLESLYHSFDQIAKRRSVFKVETVGDCYVAVAGLPDPRKDHAVVMSRFARDCILRVKDLTKKLEVSLGPDTGDLSLRVGLHSGPVTAGVLRGEKSRFQLFGDTMNTASRMESTGKSNRIQLSQETSELLTAAGKEFWFEPRQDKVLAKGKGELETCWLTIDETSSSEKFDQEEARRGRTQSVSKLSSGKISRLVDWNVDVLARLLKLIVAESRLLKNPVEISPTSPGWERDVSAGNTILDEVKETIVLPPYNPKSADFQKDAECDDLPPEVLGQLREFVSSVAKMYQDNPFHNFEHASHVSMSVVKLLSRIVAPAMVVDSNIGGQRKSHFMALQLHDHTYGITSDPLTQFACVFSALIHDVDHPGVPNSQLIKEDKKIAEFYKNKSIAEQNSVDLAWDLLQAESYSHLRSAIHQTKEKLIRFRELVVNSVMATDIMDKDLKALRNTRWDRAFSESAELQDARANRNRKATIVIEHLIQASDVSHTMQHWHVYRKWNERLFFEMYKAFVDGRAETNPTDNWYEGEIGFFDFYIIPLAKKLKECGVFGVSSAEYLNYAVKNRAEWETRGQEMVEEMASKVGMTYGGRESS